MAFYESRSDEFRVLDALKKWGVLSEKRISELSKLSHRRCATTLERLEQARRVKLVDSRESSRSYRITGSGLDHLDQVRRSMAEPQQQQQQRRNSSGNNNNYSQQFKGGSAPHQQQQQPPNRPPQ